MTFSLAELEALTCFLAERKALWREVAQNFGVENPENIFTEIIQQHQKQCLTQTNPKKPK